MVSVLMPVHNEEKIIKAKIESLYSSDYPENLFEVIVGSDSSDDNTVSLLEELKPFYPSLKIIDFKERQGKPAVVNKLAKCASGEILIITDANVFPEKDTVKKLAVMFNDKSTGLADSRLVNTGLKKEGISIPEATYISIESKLKYIEGKLWGTMMGPFGGFYAVRKNSYVPNPGILLADDFRIGMNIMLNGEKSVSNPYATVYEDASDNLKDEFLRKMRISAGDFQNLIRFSNLFLSPFNSLSFCFISHKALRWLTPFIWIFMMITCVILAGNSFFFLVFLILQVIFLFLPLVDLLLKYFKINLMPLRLFTHFCLANIALLAGFLSYLRGIRSGIWTPTKR
ncbi:MAG: glycosyltransferase [Bacteroidales bacterium]